MKISVKNIAINGAVLMVLACLFALCETIYFGSEYLPESQAEFTCDCIVLVMYVGGASLFIYSMSMYTINRIKQLKNQ